jgi:hypothetical protein
MMRILYFLFIFYSLVLTSCDGLVKKEYLQSVGIRPVTSEQLSSPCRDQLNYIPDSTAIEQTPIKYIRVNFHVICDDEGRGNFNEEEGRAFVYEVYNAANEKLGRNQQMNLPTGNHTPVLPMRYRYQLTGRPNVPGDDGIYFHNDSDYYYLTSKGKKRNIFEKDIFEKYGIQKDTVLNIFVLAHHLDSLKSDTYTRNIHGIGYTNFVKVNHWYEDVVDTVMVNGKPRVKWHKWNAVKNLNHEIGHTIGLKHSWSGNDGCEDTPNHPNCWNRTKGKAPCDTQWSNNVMDYNAHASAWSPCQIGIIHRNFSDTRKKIRQLLAPTWCTLDTDQNIEITKDTEWFGAKDLEGHLIIKDGVSLTVHCRLSLPKDAKIIVQPKAKLILNGATIENDCGEQWKGIEIWSKGDLEGQVELYNNAKILNVENAIELSEL